MFDKEEGGKTMNVDMVFIRRLEYIWGGCGVYGGRWGVFGMGVAFSNGVDVADAV